MHLLLKTWNQNFDYQVAVNSRSNNPMFNILTENNLMKMFIMCFVKGSGYSYEYLRAICMVTYKYLHAIRMTRMQYGQASTNTFMFVGLVIAKFHVARYPCMVHAWLLRCMGKKLQVTSQCYSTPCCAARLFTVAMYAGHCLKAVFYTGAAFLGKHYNIITPLDLHAISFLNLSKQCIHHVL